MFASVSDFTADARWYSEVHLNERLRLNTKIWWGFRTMRFVLRWLRFFGGGVVHFLGAGVFAFTRKDKEVPFSRSEI